MLSHVKSLSVIGEIKPIKIDQEEYQYHSFLEPSMVGQCVQPWCCIGSTDGLRSKKKKKNLTLKCAGAELGGARGLLKCFLVLFLSQTFYNFYNFLSLKILIQSLFYLY